MPSIKEKLEKSKYLTVYLEKTHVFIVISIVLIILSISGFLRLKSLFAEQDASGVTVVESAFLTNISGKEGNYVASKSGKTYYFPWCGMVNRIKDSNLVWFADRMSAEAKGYMPASNCHGLK